MFSHWLNNFPNWWKFWTTCCNSGSGQHRELCSVLPGLDVPFNMGVPCRDQSNMLQHQGHWRMEQRQGFELRTVHIQPHLDSVENVGDWGWRMESLAVSSELCICTWLSHVWIDCLLRPWPWLWLVCDWEGAVRKWRLQWTCVNSCVPLIGEDNKGVLSRVVKEIKRIDRTNPFEAFVFHVTRYFFLMDR